MNSSYDLSDLSDSPFYEYLNTNYAPTDSQIIQIRTHLFPHEAELARIESLIADLTAQRARIKSYIAPHKALISCPRRLPVELVEQIFVDCLPITHNAVMSVKEPPLLLGRICSGWRSIALSSPKLWSSLHIYTPLISNEEIKGGVTEWLTRSAPLPILLSAQSNPITFPKTYPEHDTVLPLLIPFSARWSELRLTSVSRHEAFLLAAVNSPLLERVMLDFRDDLDETDGDRLFGSQIFFGQHAQKITIVSPNPSFVVPSTDLTREHITNLTLIWRPSDDGLSSLADSILSVETAHQLMSSCRFLKSLELPMYYSEVDLIVDPPMSFPTLESLRLLSYASTLTDTMSFFDGLVLSQLITLHLTIQDAWAGLEDRLSLLRCIERLGVRSPLIVNLHLECKDLPSTLIFVQNLHVFSRLQCLDLALWKPGYALRNTYDMIVETDFIKALTPTDELNVCPELKELSVCSQNFSEGVWMSFLQANLDLRTKFRRLHLQLWYLYDASEINVIDVSQFRSRGLEVVVEYTRVPTNSGYANSLSAWEGIERP
ncbi:hypothetical protein R3P38DRAFT_1796530 [Favolaschia claudopus]|uniref:F-box domain-containing protein n=1 Tax=Favolaschia claudopus TaxID=2862362 RepID=A0AAW0A6G2_9AGAR